MNVHVLITIPEAKFEKNCTMVLDTIRTGFPTSNIRVYYNGWGKQLDLSQTVFDKCRAQGFGWYKPFFEKIHHAQWIKEVIEREEGPTVLLDGDIIFWDNCEEWKTGELIAGAYVPLMWNDFAQCVSVPRLHTSFLMIPDPKQLINALRYAYPNAHLSHGEYCPADPFYPRVTFFDRRPVFHDTCANLYNMVGGESFTVEQKDSYSHLNSACFYDVMHCRLENKIGFELLHNAFSQQPKSLRYFNRQVDDYYQMKHEQALRSRIGNNFIDFLTIPSS